MILPPSKIFDESSGIALIQFFFKMFFENLYSIRSMISVEIGGLIKYEYVQLQLKIHHWL
jgi:hypothetical protein